MFNWEKIPGDDNLRLIYYLKKEFNLVWIEKAKIDKIEKGKAIKLTAGKNSLSLSLNNEKTKVKLQINDSISDNFIAKTGNRNLKIYMACRSQAPESEIDKPTFEMLRTKAVRFVQRWREMWVRARSQNSNRCVTLLDVAGLYFERLIIFHAALAGLSNHENCHRHILCDIT